MVPALLKLAVAYSVASTPSALRRGSKKVSLKEQRADDVVIMAGGSNITDNGCACKNECQLSNVLNCNSKAFCNVDPDACPNHKSDWLKGKYDFCSFPDAGVKGTSAALRLQTLLTFIKSDKTPQNYFSGLSILTGVRGESVIHTMEMEHDVFPYPRLKYVRPVGVVAPVAFRSYGNHFFTGVFKGSELGIVRLSISLDPKETFAPGVALKFLRENRPSANFFGFTDFEGQNCSEKNFFKYGMTTNVPPATGSARAVPDKFRQATGCHQMVGLSDVADEFNGQMPEFPFEVIFSGLPSVDFSCGDKGAAGWANLGKLQKGTRLFELKARRFPGYEAKPIGELILLDSLTTSKFGDEQLFFRHQRKEEDFSWHREWLGQIDIEKECGTDYASTQPPAPEDGCDYITLGGVR